MMKKGFAAKIFFISLIAVIYATVKKKYFTVLSKKKVKVVCSFQWLTPLIQEPSTQ